MLHGDLLRIEHAGGTSWRLLRSSHGHAPDDDDDDIENSCTQTHAHTQSDRDTTLTLRRKLDVNTQTTVYSGVVAGEADKGGGNCPP